MAVGKGGIIIGNDMWMGHQSLALSGATIGDGTVVTKDAPPYAIVGGSPTRVLRMRFPPDIVERPLRVRWWDQTHEKIVKHMPLFQGQGDAHQFLLAACFRDAAARIERANLATAVLFESFFVFAVFSFFFFPLPLLFTTRPRRNQKGREEDGAIQRVATVADLRARRSR